MKSVNDLITLLFIHVKIYSIIRKCNKSLILMEIFYHIFVGGKIIE